jgi:hypothetical protein
LGTTDLDRINSLERIFVLVLKKYRNEDLGFLKSMINTFYKRLLAGFKKYGNEDFRFLKSMMEKVRLRIEAGVADFMLLTNRNRNQNQIELIMLRIGNASLASIL